MKTKIYLFILGLCVLLSSTSLIAQTLCPVPVGNVTTVITTNGATLSWSAVSATSYYKVQYRPIGINPTAWTQFYAQTNSYTLANLACATGYEWQVQTVCSNSAGTANSSAFSPSLIFTTLTCATICPMPTATTSTVINANGATATWTGVSGIGVYRIQYRPVTLSSTAWTQVTVQTNSYTFSNLSCATAYEWQVQALCNTTASGGASAFTASLTFTTLACPPLCPAPSGLNSSAVSSSSATLNWISSASSPANFMLQYRPINTAAWIAVTVQGNLSTTISSLICNTTYEWRVQTICANAGTSNGSSVFSAVATFTTLTCPLICNTPTGLTTGSISTNSALLSWTAPAGVVYYKIQYRPLSPANSNWIQQTVTSNASYTLTSLICGTAYEWQVQSICSNVAGSASSSPFSTSANFTTLACIVPCPTPTNLSSGAISANGATLSWSSTAPVPTYYIVQYHALNTTAWISVTVQGNPALTLSTLNCGTTYEWKVQTICSNSPTNGGSSTFSALSTFATAVCPATCIAPTALTTSMITASSALLSWSVPAGAAYYKIQYRPLSPVNSNWIQLPVTSTMSIPLSNLACGKGYEWQVQTICSGAIGAVVNSPFSPSSVFTTLLCAPTCTAPSTTATNGITSSNAVLTWAAVSGISTYNLQYRLVTNVVTNWTQTTVQGTTFTLANLICNALYEWQVASVCSPSGGATAISAFTPPVVFTTLACTTTCPVPSGLTSGNITSTSAYIGWPAMAGVLAYKIQYRAILPNVPPTNTWIQVTVQVNTHTLANLLCNTNYEWQVQSICSTTANGVSAFSASSYFTTLVCPATCAAPTGLFATNITPSSAVVKWMGTFSTSVYSVRYRKLNTTAWSYTTSTVNSKLISGLSIQSYYEWQVQVMCPNPNGSTTGSWSPWSVSSYFHTHFVVSVTPNPADRILKLEVKIEVDEEAPVTIELRNILGSLVYQSNERFIAGSNLLEISSVNLSEGVYFLSVAGSSGKEVTKVYIKH